MSLVCRFIVGDTDFGQGTITGGTVTDKDKAVPPKGEENPSNSSSDEPKNTEKSSSGNSNNRNPLKIMD